MSGGNLLRRIWETVCQVRDKILTMTEAETLLAQARSLIQRQGTLLDQAMTQLADKNAEIATLRDELARAQLPAGVLLTHEQYNDLMQCLNAGKANLDELERVL